MPPMEPMNYRRLLDRNMSCNWRYIVDKIVCNNDQQASIFLQQKIKIGTPDQKFDYVPEEYKATMVHELLRRIPETVIHRYACHVWQKLFELRWSDSPPQIMRYVNEALRGMWHEVALGETGSLVVQNIFENCLEEDKVRQTCPLQLKSVYDNL